MDLPFKGMVGLLALSHLVGAMALSYLGHTFWSYFFICWGMIWVALLIWFPSK